ncbi:MAG: YjbQ family protein [Candidatus Sumerlaeia bacterium]|nr:YjbQ family protein [Candidatus Sumerlaeia bacterium]
MKCATEHLTFNTKRRREMVRITEEVRRVVARSGIQEGMVLVSAMHITAAVWVNDDEPGLHDDVSHWLDALAPPGRYWTKESDADGAMQIRHHDYRHHRTGEDNADAHLKNLLIGHQVIVPVTKGNLDLGPWQQVFYMEFDGQRPKRLVIKAIGE